MHHPLTRTVLLGGLKEPAGKNGKSFKDRMHSRPQRVPNRPTERERERGRKTLRKNISIEREMDVTERVRVTAYLSPALREREMDVTERDGRDREKMDVAERECVTAYLSPGLRERNGRDREKMDVTERECVSIPVSWVCFREQTWMPLWPPIQCLHAMAVAGRTDV